MRTDTTVDANSAEMTALADRNVTLHQQYLRYMLRDEALAEEVPNGAVLVLLPDTDPELAEANLRAGIEAARRGKNIYVRHVYETGAPSDRCGGKAYTPYPSATGDEF